MIDISIILVSYNTCDLTKACIESIYEKTQNVSFEIFVVDNASKDDSVNMIKSNFQDVKLIEAGENLGFGRANNLAIKQAEGKYIFLLNTDTILINNAIKILFDFMESHSNCGACGGNLYNADGEMVHAFGYGDDIKSMLLRKTPLKFFKWKEYKNIKNYEKKADKTKLQKVNHITGADLMIRKSILDDVGVFSDKFFLYFEENELELRIRRAGYELWFVPDSQITHLEGKSVNPVRDKYYVNGYIEYYRSSYGNFWGNMAYFFQLIRIMKQKLLGVR